MFIFETEISFFKDGHLHFFISKLLQDTIATGTTWMVCAAPWASMMSHPAWPEDIRDYSENNPTKVYEVELDTIGESDVDDDGSMADIDELDDSHADLLTSQFDVEEDEVEQLVNWLGDGI